MIRHCIEAGHYLTRSSLAFLLGATVALMSGGSNAQAAAPQQPAAADAKAPASKPIAESQRQQVIILLQQIQIWEERERSTRLEKEKASLQLQGLARSICGAESELNVQTMSCEAPQPKAPAGKDGGD